jgi:hypothetical protein
VKISLIRREFRESMPLAYESCYGILHLSDCGFQSGGQLVGTTISPFPVGEHVQIAVKVIDPRCNELLVVNKLENSN